MQNSVTETTETSSIRRSPGSARPRKKKKNQLPVGFGVLFAMIIIGVLLGLRNGTLALFWAFGCSFGFILQKSRFCFTASLRDPCITGSTSITRAVLIAFAITTIGFAAIKYGAFANGQEIPGQSYIMPISLATAVGGVMFGIGMVIAGGCASGTDAGGRGLCHADVKSFVLRYRFPHRRKPYGMVDGKFYRNRPQDLSSRCVWMGRGRNFAVSYYWAALYRSRFI